MVCQETRCPFGLHIRNQYKPEPYCVELENQSGGDQCCVVVVCDDQFGSGDGISDDGDADGGVGRRGGGSTSLDGTNNRNESTISGADTDDNSVVNDGTSGLNHTVSLRDKDLAATNDILVENVGTTHDDVRVLNDVITVDDTEQLPDNHRLVADLEKDLKTNNSSSPTINELIALNSTVESPVDGRGSRNTSENVFKFLNFMQESFVEPKVPFKFEESDSLSFKSRNLKKKLGDNIVPHDLDNESDPKDDVPIVLVEKKTEEDSANKIKDEKNEMADDFANKMEDEIIKMANDSASNMDEDSSRNITNETKKIANDFLTETAEDSTQKMADDPNNVADVTNSFVDIETTTPTLDFVTSVSISTSSRLAGVDLLPQTGNITPTGSNTTGVLIRNNGSASTSSVGENKTAASVEGEFWSVENGTRYIFNNEAVVLGLTVESETEPIENVSETRSVETVTSVLPPETTTKKNSVETTTEKELVETATEIEPVETATEIESVSTTSETELFETASEKESSRSMMVETETAPPETAPVVFETAAGSRMTVSETGGSEREPRRGHNDAELPLRDLKQLEVERVTHNASVVRLPSFAAGDLFYKGTTPGAGRGRVGVEVGEGRATLSSLTPSTNYSLSWLGADASVAHAALITLPGCTHAGGSVGLGEGYVVHCTQHCTCTAPGTATCAPCAEQDAPLPPGCSLVPRDPCCSTLLCPGKMDGDAAHRVDVTSNSSDVNVAHKLDRTSGTDDVDLSSRTSLVDGPADVDGPLGTEDGPSGTGDVPKLIVMRTSYDSVTLAWDDFRSGDAADVYMAEYRHIPATTNTTKTADAAGKKADSLTEIPAAAEDKMAGPAGWQRRAVDMDKSPPTVTITSLLPGATYQVRVVAVDGGATAGQRTETLTVTTQPGCVYANATYAIGSFARGCEEACACYEDGFVKCTERCTVPYFRRGSVGATPLCEEQRTVADDCCVLVVCATRSGAHEFDQCANIVCGPNAECVSEHPQRNSSDVTSPAIGRGSANDTSFLGNSTSDWSNTAANGTSSSLSTTNPVAALTPLSLDVSPLGQCVCLPGYHGNPTNLETGCHARLDSVRCHHHNLTYSPGEVFYEGCVSRCLCTPTGEIDCRPRCSAPPPPGEACDLRSDPNDPCCTICTNATSTGTSRCV
ncbi:uncharacterized protein LOC108677090 [Hyalella azteca]|uniref:Uncharacterized protein LOC108677090 n=1 Tax=Hyalella azteca TaxID=294128 RepID=A0A8B7P3V2_HYAAZ|nr:uncharacterized protein LOC108677090 [Hyalella azteca]